MIIKEARYKNVMTKQRRMVSEAVYGCDDCKAPIVDFPNESQRLELTVFHKTHEATEHLHFCSWRCVLNHIPKIRTDYFVSLPIVYFDEPKGKRNISSLIKELQKRAKSKQ